MPARRAPVTAAIWHRSSSSAARPCSRAAANNATGASRSPPRGPRARASTATVAPDARSTIGW